MSNAAVKKTAPVAAPSKPVAVLPEGPVVVSLPGDQIRVMVITIEGDPEGMLQNRLTEEARDTIQNGKKPEIMKISQKAKSEKKRAEWLNTAHVTEDGQYGHPSEAFSKAMVRASEFCKIQVGDTKKTTMAMIQRLIQIVPDTLSVRGVPLVLFRKCKANANVRVEPAEHWAVLNRKTPIPLYRTHISDWTMKVHVAFDTSMLTSEAVLMMVQKVGAQIGIGAYRKDRGGSFGGFSVKSAYILAAGKRHE